MALFEPSKVAPNTNGLAPADGLLCVTVPKDVPFLNTSKSVPSFTRAICYQVFTTIEVSAHCTVVAP